MLNELMIVFYSVKISLNAKIRKSYKLKIWIILVN